ncbi:MAG: glycosyltransferase family 4 protein, partial [Burkholderiales bacterium]|nr:glycosyltransferase family 4 protein [Anaerolineae bacterium]
MRVLYWTELFHPDTGIGGVEVASLPVLHGLIQRGIECMVITSRSASAPQDESEYEGIPVYRFPFHAALLSQDPLKILALVRRVAELKAKLQPDMIHLNTNQGSLFFHQRTFSADCPTLHAIREPLQSEDPNSMIGRALRQATWLITPSQAMRAEILRSFPDAEPRLTCIPHGLPTPALKPTPLPFNPPRVLCIGRLVKEKGFDLAISAFASVLQRFPDARLTIAGTGSAESELIAQAAALGIQHAVNFIGFVQPVSVPRLMNEATMVVVPSRWFEVFGVVAVEAGQMARPVIAARTGGLPEIVIDGETGLLFERENSPALAEAMLTLLSQPETAIHMGEAGYRHVTTAFSLQRYLDD